MMIRVGELSGCLVVSLEGTTISRAGLQNLFFLMLWLASAVWLDRLEHMHSHVSHRYETQS